MKLTTKTIFYYLLISIPLIVISITLSFFIIQKEVKEATDEALYTEKNKATQLIQALKPAHTLYISPDSLSFIQPLSHPTCDTNKWIDTLIFNPIEKEKVPARQYVSYFQYHSRYYLIVLTKLAFEDEELLEALWITFGLIIFFLVMSLIVSHYLLSKYLWKPFYDTLHQLQHYNIRSHSSIHLPNTNILEFQHLNKVLYQMIEKIHQDYYQQKEFIENASHEMQTPISVLKTNVNLLLQSPHLREQEMLYLQSIDNTIQKLSSLLKSLLLLSKIENQQFSDTTQISILQLIKQLISFYEPIIQLRKITVHIICQQDTILNMNATLSEVMMQNLLQNAIKYNIPNGKILIDITEQEFRIANTGEPLNIPKKDIFKRFQKGHTQSDSHGLGLAIVQSIVNLYGFQITYQYQNAMHQFIIQFQTKSSTH